MDSVSVSVPARLHLGFLDINGSLGRKFGSLGVAISAPETRLTLRRSTVAAINGAEAARAGGYLDTMTRVLNISGAFDLTIHEAIPAHSGLGSGTQLALAVAAALRSLAGLPLDPRGDAVLLDRGARSGIGIGLFSSGGLVLDAGRTAAGGPPPVIARHPFPEDWRIILLQDTQVQGVHGQEEREAFIRLPVFPESEAAQLCRIVLIQAMPAIIEKDIVQFGLAIADIQRRLGDYFAPAQGGRYTSKAVEAMASTLAAAGAHGCGQSSWGPTGFAFASSQAEAERLVNAAAPEATASGLHVSIVRGQNAGARIEPSKGQS